ncbi:hypothetical protein Lalb_Chr09g0334161 [Lupinus albus]|uniref:DUF4283 domain-containing protein n=1 Tax=Lupinus albus TaxID=3870 RepID=A0A6A4Q2R9_LUPAL|nr:hypothetical protein Lalb_Chr09g0334161 [Lupinus albus]
MNNTIIPWNFLMDSSTPSILTPTHSIPTPIAQQKSFADVIKVSCDVSQLPQPRINGNTIAVKIPEEEYQAGLLRCKTHLHGRVILSKGDAPVKFLDLKGKLSARWNKVGKWTMISLGRGFYEFSFSYIEDMRRVCALGSWNLNPGFFRVFPWTPDFNPTLQRMANVQCWVKLVGLPQEYWSPKIIFSIVGV